jgi:hypothetical protein
MPKGRLMPGCLMNEQFNLFDKDMHAAILTKICHGAMQWMPLSNLVEKAHMMSGCLHKGG